MINLILIIKFNKYFIPNSYNNHPQFIHYLIEI